MTKLCFSKAFITLYLSVLFFTFVLGSCSPQSIITSQLKREWMLVEMQGFTKSQLVSSKASMNLSQFSNEKKDNQVAVFMGCNMLNFTWISKKDGVFKVDNAINTLKMCDKNMDVEMALQKLFPAMSIYQVDGHFLTLSNDKGERLKFVAADWD